MNNHHSSPAITRSPVHTDTIFSVRQASNATISPDGQYAAFLVGKWQPEQQKMRQRLWFINIKTNDSYPLTKDQRDDRAPSWSPDSKYLAFASKPDSTDSSNQAQLYILDVHSGELRQCCTLPNGVSSVSWSPDGSRIAFLSLEGPAPATDPIVLSNTSGRHTRLWTVAVTSDQPEPITPNGLTIWHYAWSSDSTRFAVYYATGPKETDWYRGQIGLVPTTGGNINTISQLKRQAHNLTWSPDNSRIAYISGEWSDPDRGGGDIFVHTLATNEVRNLTPNISWSPTWCQWLNNNTQLLCAGWDGTTTQIALLDEYSGHLTTLDKSIPIGDRGWPHLSLSSTMQSAVTTRSHQHPYDVWLANFTTNTQNQITDLSWQRLTRLNPIAEETLSLPQTEHIQYAGTNGWPIEAIITRPAQHDFTTPPPLIVNVHGGPSGIWLDDWEFYRSQVLAAAGYVVLRPNIRGSMGRGVSFADAVIGDMGGQDFQDIMHGIDYLIEQKLVDGDRIGLMGWSYGGFMAAWAVTQTNRFNAAIMGAGISDFHSFHAQTNIQDWDMRFLGQVNEPVSPLTHNTLYRERSPITYAYKVSTPTLIVHGANDACVPINQAYAFYRTLQELSIPSELVIYPREGHGLSERDHMHDYLQRVVDWFNQHIK